MPPPRPTLLLLDTQPARQVALTDRLSSEFRLTPLPPNTDVLRHVRVEKPDMVVLVVHPGRSARSYRLAHTLKTDLNAVRRLAVVNIEGPGRALEDVRERDFIDAYYEGPADLDAITAFVRAVWSGEDRYERNERSKRQRLLGRLVARWRS